MAAVVGGPLSLSLSLCTARSGLGCCQCAICHGSHGVPCDLHLSLPSRSLSRLPQVQGQGQVSPGPGPGSGPSGRDHRQGEHSGPSGQSGRSGLQVGCKCRREGHCCLACASFPHSLLASSRSSSFRHVSVIYSLRATKCRNLRMLGWRGKGGKRCRGRQELGLGLAAAVGLGWGATQIAKLAAKTRAACHHRVPNTLGIGAGDGPFREGVFYFQPIAFLNCPSPLPSPRPIHPLSRFLLVAEGHAGSISTAGLSLSVRRGQVPGLGSRLCLRLSRGSKGGGGGV